MGCGLGQGLSYVPDPIDPRRAIESLSLSKRRLGSCEGGPSGARQGWNARRGAAFAVGTMIRSLTGFLDSGLSRGRPGRDDDAESGGAGAGGIQA